MRTLYLTYTGLLEPLGASQVIPHLRGLAAAGWEIDAVSWEKSERLADRAQLETVAGELRRSGVSWRPLRYHKSPTAPATAYDLSRGLAHLARRARPRRWGLVHVRSYVPVPLAMLVKRWLGARFVFDMRGFWADEYADCGIWGKESSLFRTVKDWEGAFLRAADQVVVLTHEARRVLEEGHPRLPRPWRREAPPIQVIPTCANLDLFRPDGPTHPRGEALRKNHFVVGYVGSVGTWYEFDAMFDLINAARREDPSIHFVVVTQTPEHEVRGLADARGLPAAALTGAPPRPHRGGILDPVLPSRALLLLAGILQEGHLPHQDGGDPRLRRAGDGQPRRRRRRGTGRAERGRLRHSRRRARLHGRDVFSSAKPD